MKAILTNPRYHGEVPRNDGQTFKAAFPPLVDDETWRAVVRVRMGQPHFGRSPHRKYRPYILTRLLRCAHCSGTMSGYRQTPPSDRAQEPRPHYYCYTRRVEGNAGCRAPRIPQEIIEEQVLALLRAMLLPDGLAEAVDVAVATYAKQQRSVSRATWRRSIDDQLRRWNDVYVEGGIRLEEYSRRCQELCLLRDQLALEPRAGSIAAKRDQLRTIVDDWPRMSDDERARLLGLIFLEIRASYSRWQGLSVAFKVRAEWEPYVEAVLARQAERSAAARVRPVTTSEQLTRQYANRPLGLISRSLAV